MGSSGLQGAKPLTPRPLAFRTSHPESQTYCISLGCGAKGSGASGHRAGSLPQQHSQGQGRGDSDKAAWGSQGAEPLHSFSCRRRLAR